MNNFLNFQSRPSAVLQQISRGFDNKIGQSGTLKNFNRNIIWKTSKCLKNIKVWTFCCSDVFFNIKC